LQRDAEGNKEAEMIGGTVVSDPISKQSKAAAPNNSAATEEAIEQIRESLRGLQFGSVNIIVQDGVIIQIDRTEKKRLRGSHNGAR
jgi:hypothetical protein